MTTPKMWGVDGSPGVGAKQPEAPFTRMADGENPGRHPGGDRRAASPPSQAMVTVRMLVDSDRLSSPPSSESQEPPR